MASDYSNAPDLDDTSDRQAALRRYHILDTKPEKNFDRITSLVAKVCEVPTALITLIDEERQWFKSCFGFDARETDVGISFCVHAVHQGEMLVVEDATEDPRFKDNPIVTGPPHIRFYAGAPLTTPDGVHIGTLCIIDYEARTFDAAQREILERLADVVVNQFELRSAEAQVRQLVDENPQPMYVYAQSDGALLRANEAARTLYGHDDVSSLTAADLEAPAADQPSSEDIAMHRRADGSFFPVRLREREVLFDGRAAVLAVPQSVTERHDSDTTVFFQTDLEGTTQSLSAEWTAATGFGVEDTVGSPLLDFVHPLDRSSTSDLFSSLLNGATDTCQHEADFLTEDGKQSFAMHARLVRDASGQPVGAAGTLTPIIEEESAPFPTEDDGAAADDPAPEATDPGTPAPAPRPPSAGNEVGGDDAPTDDAPSPVAGAHGDDDGTADTDETDAVTDPAAQTADDADTAANGTDEAGRPSPDDASEAPTGRGDGTRAADENGDDIGGVFSTDLPSFADAAPSSPSAPIDGPSDEADEEATGPDGDADEAAGPSRELHPGPFDFVAQLRDVLDTKDQAARQQNVALRRSLPDRSVPVRLDAQAVRDVLDTLVDAALPHADGEAVTVRVETSDDDVALYVDGTAPAAETALLRSARRLVEAMDGTLSLDEQDDGSGLALALPRSPAPNGDANTSILSSISNG